MLTTLHLIFPVQIIVAGLVCYLTSLWVGKRLPAIGFFLFFAIGSFGSSLFGVSALAFGLYSVGYIISSILAQQKDFGPINIVHGLVTIFFPITVFSILSATRFASYTSLFSQSGNVIAVCVIILSASSLYFIFKERDFVRNLASNTFVIEKYERKPIFLNFAFFILLGVLFVVINYSFVPLINYDDMGTHYPLQHRFANGFYPMFDVSLHVWAVSQWVFDLYYGVFEYFFPNNGRSYLNVILALSTAAIIYRSLKSRLHSISALFLTIICCSTPLFTLALTTSQTELISVLLLASLVYLFVNYHARTLVLALPVLAFAVAIKPSNAVLFIFPFIVFLFVDYRRYKFNTLKSILFWVVFAISAFCAFITYIFAYFKSGNPFFPLFNGYFKAAHFPDTNFFNALYSGHFDTGAFWGLLFHTSMYLESYDYVAGFQLLILPIALCAVPFFFKRNYEICLLFISIIVGGVALFQSQQYARYLMPCITLLPVFYALIIDRGIIKRKILSLSMTIVLIVIGSVNMFFTPNVIWYLKTWENKFSILGYNEENQQPELDAILSVNRFLNALPGNKVVVYPPRKPYAANFNGKYIYINWYNTAANNAVKSGKEGLINYFKSQGVTHLIISEFSTDDDRSIARDFGVLIYDANGYQVYKLF